MVCVLQGVGWQWIECEWQEALQDRVSVGPTPDRGASTCPSGDLRRSPARSAQIPRAPAPTPERETIKSNQAQGTREGPGVPSFDISKIARQSPPTGKTILARCESIHLKRYRMKSSGAMIPETLQRGIKDERDLRFLPANAKS